MIRLVLRQYRWLITATALLALLLSALLLWNGLKTDALTAAAITAGCPDARGCGAVMFDTTDSYKSIGLPLQFFMFVPAVIGAAWGAPLVSRELEQHTAVLAWTQSISRRYWLAARLAVLGTILTACGSLTAVAITWWSERYRNLYQLIGAQPQALMAQIRGYEPPIWWLFAFVLGVVVGLLIRKTLATIAVTVGILLIISIVLLLVTGATNAAMLNWGAALAAAQAPVAGTLAGLSILLTFASFHLIDRAPT